ncbi:MAG: hypothetical protein ACKVYV_07390 [Limisphaerales bacterium]
MRSKFMGRLARAAAWLTGLLAAADVMAASLPDTTSSLSGPRRNIVRHGVELPQNYVWPLALELQLTDHAGVLRGMGAQALETEGEARWFKFRVQPGSRVVVTLTGLPANYDLALFKDIQQAFDEIVTGSDLPLLDAEFADDTFTPGDLSSSAFAPESLAPDAFAPAQFSPAQFSPAQFSPAQFSPAQFSPAQFSPAQFSQDAFAPAQFSPAQFSPAQFSPAQFSPAQFSPAQFSPAQFSDAYAGAQVRSVIAVSAFDGLAPEGVVVETWNNDTYFYVMVRGRQGAFDPDSSFRLDVYLYPGACAQVSPIPVDGGGNPLPAPTLAAPAGGFRTLILTDLDRLAGPDATPVRAMLEMKLGDFAARPEVGGHILDLSEDPWIQFFARQAEAHPSCPYAKNLLAEAIRDVIERSRNGNPLEYVVLAGGDGVIPFFREPDEALLGPEEDYFPPMLGQSASEASLRLNFFLTQDPYGARCEVSRKLTVLPVPDLAVGRLIETPAEITGQLDAYLGTAAGVLPAPTTALVTGYDFLDDVARAVVAELESGLGGPVESLITPATEPPASPASWTATDLRAKLLGSRHDLIFLAGHFSAASALAADYRTRLNAGELAASPLNLELALLYSAGCHSGYNLVDGDVVPFLTLQPDWPQAAARKKMLLIAGTGYQYGDTEFIEYSERLYLDFTRELRTGTGPVPAGKALFRAKRKYLAEVADLRGIHHKSLLQTTLYGLPMAAVDLPGARLTPATAPTVIAATQGYAVDPGLTLGLRRADLAVTPTLTQHSLELNDATGGGTVTATWLSGAAGVASQPAEPVLPLEFRNVTVPNFSLRGIGFRGGEFADTAGIVPLTGAATTEIRGVHPAFLTDVFFPVKFWRANYFDALCGGDGTTRLVVTPAQFISDPPDSASGIQRRWNRTDFRLFYSDYTASTPVPGEGFSVSPALAAPPTIARVSAVTDGDDVAFDATVVGLPAAGIQEVWVTYTAVTGPFAGRWTSLDLVQDAADSRQWKGRLARGTTPSADFRFIVQAVNGVGLVALQTQLGAFFIPDRTDPPAVPPATAEVALLAPPASAPYGSRVGFRARLTSGGSPVAGERLVFKLGGQQLRAQTGADGVAEVTMNVLAPPRDYELTALYRGSPQYDAADDTVGFTVTKAPAALVLVPTSATTRPGAPETLVARLTTDGGFPLLEETVLFVVEGQGGAHVVAAITDFNGEAGLGPVNLPPGAYTVTASFALPIAPPPPFPAIATDSPRYLGASAAGTLTLDAEIPAPVDDFVLRKSGPVLKVPLALLLANDIDPGGGALEIADADLETYRGATIERDGDWFIISGLQDGVVDGFAYIVQNTGGLQAAARVRMEDNANIEPSVNLLGIEFVGGNVRIRFAGIPGRTYAVQFTPSLNPPAWATLGNATVGPDGLAVFVAPAPPAPAGFYRTARP